jgi:DNA-binding protein HU-beta
LRAEPAIKRLRREKKFAHLLSLNSHGKVEARTNLFNTTKRKPSVNKSELIEIAAKEADITKAAAEKTLAATISTIVKAVAKGDTVTLVGFGTFKSSKRAARTGRNPQTGKELKIAATTVPRFTAGATFKAAVAGKKAAKKK